MYRLHTSIRIATVFSARILRNFETNLHVNYYKLHSSGFYRTSALKSNNCTFVQLKSIIVIKHVPMLIACIKNGWTIRSYYIWAKNKQFTLLCCLTFMYLCLTNNTIATSSQKCDRKFCSVLYETTALYIIYPNSDFG